MSSEQVVEALKPNSNVPLKDKISILEEFSRALKEPVSREQSQAIFSSTPLDLFYYGFSLEQEKLTEILCQVVNKLMGPLSYQEIPFKFLVEGLTHYDAQIRFLSIQQVFKCLESIDFIKSMVQSEIFMHVIITLSFQDTKTAQKANELLFQISRHIPEALFGTSSILHQLLTVSETVKFRIYELMIKVASESDQAFESCEKTGLLEAYLNELQSQDLLVKLNAIEMLNEIAATASGIRFLEKARLVEDMSAVLKDQDEDVVVSLVKCALIKFLGNLGENTQVPFQKLSNDYGILENLSECLDSSNEEVVIVTISSIGLIGSHLKGLALLLSETDLVNVLANMYLSVVGSVKAVLIQTLSKLIGVRQEPESDLLTQDVFKQ
ncbi:hypothetical protein G6F56_004377 [Rhizopus delemar]|nr:hypothetical protein G6F56_004377 [Rhizopus delemar]